jgi:hypothetical protein
VTEPIEPTAEASPEITTTEAGGAGESTGTNPAWEPVLSLLPDRIQESVKPHLSEWDANYRKLQDEFNEYKKTTAPRDPSPHDEFKDIPPEDIRAALGIAQTISSDPRRVAEVMAEQLGLSLSEKKELEKELKQAEVEFTEDDDPRLKQFYEQQQQAQKQLEEMQQQQRAFFEQQRQIEEEKIRQQEIARTNQEVDAELNVLFQSHPELKNNQPLLNQVFITAGALAQQGSQSPLKDAYNQVTSLIGSSHTAPASTPLFVPTGGQAPPAQDTAAMSTRDRALQMLQTLHSNGQG